MIKEDVKASGTLTIVKNGVVVRQEENLVVSTGLSHMSARLLSAADAVISHMGLGSGTTAAALSQTALVSELDREPFSSATQVTTNTSNDSVQYVADFPPGSATGAITEAALLNSTKMLSRTTFPVVNKQALDTISITWKIVIT